MGHEVIGYDDAGAHFQGRIKELRSTLQELYHKTRSYEAERAEVARRKLHAESTPVVEGSDSMFEAHDLVDDLAALTDAANAYGQAFIMVLNPALQELKSSVGDIFELGPIVHANVHLSRALWEIANAVRHRHKVAHLSLTALHLSGGTMKHFTGVLARLGISAKHLGASKVFITKWGPPTYREFEDQLLEIGRDATEQFPGK